MATQTAAPGPGHNSAAQLKGYAERLNRLNEDKKSIGEDVAELKKEAKAAGVEPAKVVRLARLMRKGPEEAKAELDELEASLTTLGWLAD